jgi:tRNA 2-thiocytidine biosynthesis protein TtcA
MNTVTEPVFAADARAPVGRAAPGPEHKSKAPVDIRKLAKRLHRQVGQAIADFNMIEPGDKIMVCLSGGKDSYGLLDILLSLRQRAPVPFDIVVVNLDQKQPGFPEEVLPAYLRSREVPFHIEAQDTYSIVKRLVPEGKTMCSLCSRLRRGILYRVAGELGATKIALGHHRDDMVVTLLMNMFFGSRMKGMPPKLVSDDGRHVVIRPLAYVAESDLARWATHRQFPIIPCTLCGSQDNLQRVQVKKMIHEWERQYPGRIDSMFSAMGKIVPSHMMDRKLYPFETLQTTGVADRQGDRAFDEDEDEACAPPAQGPARGVQTIRIDAIGRSGGEAAAEHRSSPWLPEEFPKP